MVKNWIGKRKLFPKGWKIESRRNSVCSFEGIQTFKTKKLLTKSIAYDNINKLSMRQQQRTLKTEQYVKP